MARHPSAADVLSLVTSSLANDKAEDITLIELAGKTSIADTMVIASGTSSRHVGAMAEHIAQKLKQSGMPSVAIEGAAVCDWVLIDAGDVLVHLFRPEVRRFYALERLWGAPSVVRADLASG